ncbi:MAG: PASTA domain-containing protein [Oscillospiraceae bacterium]
MHIINCKKCGAQIDADLGECPNCGAVYYILPNSDNSSPSMSEDTSRIFGGNSGETFRNAEDIIGGGNDDLFNTTVWKHEPDPDATRAFKTYSMPSTPPPAQPQRQRPVQSAQQRPVPQRQRQAAPAGNSRYGTPPPQREDPNKRKKQMLVGAVALVALLTLVLAIMSGAFSFGDKEALKMDGVVGQTIEMATTVLEGKGLVVTPSTEKSDEPEGTVIRQSIKEGQRIKKGDKVTLTVSIGKGKDEETPKPEEYVEAPSLVGSTFDAARSTLSALGLGITSAEDAYDENIPAGVIISQSPLKGAKLLKGDLVTVTISKGKEPAKGFDITVTAGKGGTVSPKGVVTVEEGKSQSFTITPDSGYEIREVKIDGQDIGAQTGYTFTNVTGAHTVYVVFQVKPTPTPSPVPTPTPAPTPPPATLPPENPVKPA